MVRPQLPAYLLALKKGFLPGPGPCGDKVKAGYVALKRASDINISPLKEYQKDVDWEEFLPRWEEEVAQRIGKPLTGLFRPEPRPSPEKGGGACKHCPYGNLCGIDSQKEMDEEDEQ